MGVRGLAKSALGLAGVGLLGAALPAMMYLGTSVPEMSVVVTSTTPYSEGEAPTRLRPARLSKDLDLRGTVEGMGPGVFLRTWRATYGHQWEKEVSWPTISGPLTSPAMSVCGYGLRIGADVIDPSRGAPGLRLLAERKLRDTWADVAAGARAKGVDLADLQSLDVRLRPGTGLIDVSVRILMRDGAALDVGGSVRLGAEDGALTVTFEDVVATPNDKLVDLGRRAALSHPVLGTFNFLTFGVFSRNIKDIGEDKLRSTAQRSIADETDKIGRQITAELLALRDLASPIPGRVHDRVRIEVPSPPEVSTDGVTMWPCVSGRQGAGAHNEPPGYPALAVGRPRLGSTGMDQVTLAMNTNALNQALFVAWSSGLLQSLGATVFSEGPRNALLEKLAFEVRGIEPLVPPWTAGTGVDGSRLRFHAFGLRLGEWDGPTGGRDVVAHLQLDAGLVARDNVVKISGAVGDVRANCMTRGPGTFTLTPCLGDLVPVARMELAGQEKEMTFNAGNWFGQLRRKSLSGVHIDIRELDAVVDGQSIRARARVRLVGGDHP